MGSLTALIEQAKPKIFVDPSTASSTETLGILVSQHVEWDGLAIAEVAVAAFTDANFHAEASQVAALFGLEA